MFCDRISIRKKSSIYFHIYFWEFYNDSIIYRHNEWIGKGIVTIEYGKVVNSNEIARQIMRTLEEHKVIIIQPRRGQNISDSTIAILKKSGIQIIYKNEYENETKKMHMRILLNLSECSEIISHQFTGKFLVRIDEYHLKKFIDELNHEQDFWKQAGTVVENKILEIFDKFNIRIGCGPTPKLAFFANTVRNTEDLNFCENYSNILYLKTTNDVLNFDERSRNIETYTNFKKKIDLLYKTSHIKGKKSLINIVKRMFYEIFDVLENQMQLVTHVEVEVCRKTFSIQYEYFNYFSVKFVKQLKEFLNTENLESFKQVKVIVYFKEPPEAPVFSKKDINLINMSFDYS